MNEYLSKPGCKWGDANFTDVFPTSTLDNSSDETNDISLYLDTPLSNRGIKQANELSQRIQLGKDNDEPDVIKDIDLIIVSPLTRALQTMELGLLPHIAADAKKVPIVALPLAAERLYLISDVGKPTSELSERFPYVDFESEFSNNNNQDYHWWYTFDNDATVQNTEYVEWRPINEGQTYACKGEPSRRFHRRMVSLYDWLDARTESTIALVTHWGVIQWLIGQDFQNCEMRIESFDDNGDDNASFRRNGFMLSDEEEKEIFSEGETLIANEMKERRKAD